MRFDGIVCDWGMGIKYKGERRRRRDIRSLLREKTIRLTRIGPGDFQRLSIMVWSAKKWTRASFPIGAAKRVPKRSPEGDSSGFTTPNGEQLATGAYGRAFQLRGRHAVVPHDLKILRCVGTISARAHLVWNVKENGGVS